MIDWTAFHAATAAGTRPELLANACARVWRWIDLEPEPRDLALASIATDAEAHPTLDALTLVWRRLWREAGVDPTDRATFQRVLDDLAAGHATEPVVTAAGRTELVIAMKHCLAARFPPAPQNQGHQDIAQLNAATPALSRAIEAVGAGLATPASLSALSEAIDTFERVGRTMGAAAQRQHAWWMGLAWWAMGRGAQEATRHADAQAAFARAAVHYESAGEAVSADQCRHLSEEVAVRLRADVDAASAADVRALLAEQAPLQRAATLTRLSVEVGRAGDRFEAAELAEEAAALLHGQGYPDPELTFDAAIQQWLTTAAASRQGNDLFAVLCNVIGDWAAVLGARSSERLATDPEGSLRAERTLRGLSTLTAELSRQADLARQASLARFAAWDPGSADLATDRSSDGPADPATTYHQMDDALQALRLACNEGASAFQLDEADRLLARAEAVGSRLHAARALVERAYVLLALGRDEEVAGAADLAMERLLAGKPARLDSFASHHERELYLTAMTYKARAAARGGNHERVLAIGRPVLTELETERGRVSSPYQQSAALATRKEIYELVAAAAFRAGQADILLATTELLKSRAALASLRRTSDKDDDGADSEAVREWRAVNASLRLATPGSADMAALRERRRWLSMLVAIERKRAAHAPAEIGVGDVTDALASDEAAISWFWVSPDAVILQAFTREDRAAAVVHLDASQHAQLQEYLECVCALGEPTANSGMVRRLGEIVDDLGAALLPSPVRGLVAGKRRLVLSPHRSLHLFPLHAVRWDADGTPGRLIEHVAVRYVPNLTSLLLPWHGTHRGRVLAVGVAEFERPGLPPLPGAAAEASAVAAIHADLGDLLLAPDRAEFIARLSTSAYRCLHLATHGSTVLADEVVDDPLQACLSLRDGDLSAWDLSALDLRAELVVLAACHSGQRAVSGRGLASLPGDDLFGLQAVLFEAGVWGVLGSLWPADDETSLEIMGDFHRAYAEGQPADIALHHAIRTHLRTPGRRRSLYYWAPFVLSVLGRHAR